MAFENEALVEKAPVLPDTVRFDSVFSNDLAEEQDYDVCFGAEEDDELIAMVSQDELFSEAGYERPYVSLNEEDEEDEEDFDAAADDTQSSDVEDSEESGDEEPAEDENMLEDSEEDEEPVAPAPTVQVNVDADDVNIQAEAPAQEANLLEDDVEIDNATTVNIINSPEGEAPTTEPAAAPVPATDDSEDHAVVSEPEEAPAEEPNLLEDPEEDEEPEAPADECGAACRESDDVSDGDISDEEITADECSEANILEDDDMYNPFIDRANPAQTNVYVGSQDQEIPGTTDTPNLLEESDDGDPTMGDAPSGNKEISKTGAPEHTDTSHITGMSDEKFEKNKEDAMTTVDDLGFAEANLLEADEDPKAAATEEDGEASLNVAISSNMLGGVEGVESMWNGIDVNLYNDGSAAAAQDSVPNLLESEVSDDFSDIAKIDNEDKFHDDLEDINLDGTPSTMNKLPVDSTKKEEGIDDFKDTENNFEDNIPDQCPVTTMNNAPEDSTKKELGIENDKNKSVENNFADDLYKIVTADPAKIMNNAPEDTSKVDEANLLEAEDEEVDPDATEGGNVDVPTDECSEANLLEEEEGKIEDGILQADNPSDDTSMYAAIEQDPNFPKKDADFSELKEMNLLEDDAETNFEGIADKNSTPADSFEVTPDEVAVPAEDRDPDGIKASVGGPIEKGNDTPVAPTHEDVNLLEMDYEEQVEAISSDGAFYDTINKGVSEPPVNLLDTEDDDTADDKLVDEV